MPEVSARPDFVTDLRSQLVVEAARQARPVVDADLRLRLTPRQRSGVRERRAATVLGGFAIVAATGSMADGSQSALPGDVLYPVKRAIENAQTNLQSDDAAKAQTLIAHAERRLEEAEQLTAEGADATTVAETLQDFTEQSNQATELALDDYAATGDQDAIGDLRSFADESMDDLGILGDVVPADARAALITAAQSVRQARLGRVPDLPDLRRRRGHRAARVRPAVGSWLSTWPACFDLASTDAQRRAAPGLPRQDRGGSGRAGAEAARSRTRTTT